MLILQDLRYLFPNDAINGGVMFFEFPYPVYNISAGFLDIDNASDADTDEQAAVLVRARTSANIQSHNWFDSTLLTFES